MRRWAALLACLFATAALAGDGINLDSIAGVYKTRHAIEVYQGQSQPPDRPVVEDVLEIVKFSPRTAYFRVHLMFDNEHRCNLHGVAALEGNALVYRRPTRIYDDKRKGEIVTECIFRMNAERARISLVDEGDRCRESTCGARGVYRGTVFEMSARRPIRYMARLKASQQYRDAMAEAGIKP